MKNKIFEILKKDKPYDVLFHMFNTGELKKVLPELYELHTTTEEGHKNNFYHTLGVLKNVCDLTDDVNMKLVAIFHDIGKIATKKEKPNSDGSMGWSFHNHELVSANMTMDIFDRWGITDPKLREYIYKMIKYHGRVKMHRDVTEAAIRRLDNSVGQDVIFDLIDFCKCDLTTKYDHKRQRIVDSLNTITERIKEVRAKDEDAKWRSPITGYVIMQLLGTVEGPVIGKIKKVVDPKLKTGEWSEKDAIDYIINNYKS
jgi:poly(A) polymerase